MSSNLPRQLRDLLERGLEQFPDATTPNQTGRPDGLLCIRGDNNTVVYAPQATAPIHINTCGNHCRHNIA